MTRLSWQMLAPYQTQGSWFRLNTSQEVSSAFTGRHNADHILKVNAVKLFEYMYATIVYVFCNVRYWLQIFTVLIQKILFYKLIEHFCRHSFPCLFEWMHHGINFQSSPQENIFKEILRYLSVFSATTSLTPSHLWRTFGSITCLT